MTASMHSLGSQEQVVQPTAVQAKLKVNYQGSAKVEALVATLFRNLRDWHQPEEGPRKMITFCLKKLGRSIKKRNLPEIGMRYGELAMVFSNFGLRIKAIKCFETTLKIAKFLEAQEEEVSYTEYEKSFYLSLQQHRKVLDYIENL